MFRSLICFPPRKAARGVFHVFFTCSARTNMNLFIHGFVCVCVQKDRWRFQTAAVANCSRFLMMHFFSASHPDGLHATDQPNEQWSEEGMCVTPRTPHLLSSALICIESFCLCSPQRGWPHFRWFSVVLFRADQSCWDI